MNTPRSQASPKHDPWQLRIDGFDELDQPRRETLFGMGNGVLFVRACAPEADAVQPSSGLHYAGLYGAGIYDATPRQINGQPALVASLVNLPHPFILSFRIGEAEWFSSGVDDHDDFTQCLDLASGVLERRMVVRDSQGRHTRLHETRCVSAVDPGLVLLRWRLTALDWAGTLEVRSRVSRHVCNTKVSRTAAYEGRHASVQPRQAVDGLAVSALTCDEQTAVDISVRLDVYPPHLEGPVTVDVRTPTAEALWQTARIGEMTLCDICDIHLWVLVNPHHPDAVQTSASGQDRLPARSRHAFDQVLSDHRQAWRRWWKCIEFSMPHHPEIEMACRFNAYHLLSTCSPLSASHAHGMPARGWQEGYFGHVFWDDLFACAFFTSRFPEVGKSLLTYRHRHLGAARQAARAIGQSGAMFPWRSAKSGGEETPPFQWIPPAGRWIPDHTNLQRHVGSAIAYNAWQYFCITGDRDALAGRCGELIVEIARFWRSMLQPGRDNRLEIRGVIGPDEYHTSHPATGRPGLDNNAYTNVMAAWTLRCAAGLRSHLDDARWQVLSTRLRIDAHEPSNWIRGARAIRVPLLAHDVIAQFDGCDALLPVDAPTLDGRDPQERADWWLLEQGDDVNRYQLTKQADVLMLCHMLGRDGLQDLFAEMGYHLSAGWYERTVDYYMDRVSHESSLSHAGCAGALACFAAEGSWTRFLAGLRTDLDEGTSASTHEGVHLGAMAGSWDVLQRWYLGLWPTPVGLRLDPHPPPQLDDVRLSVRHHSLWLDVHLSGEQLHLSARSGDTSSRLVIECAGERHFVGAGDRLSVRCGRPPSWVPPMRPTT